jgi:hypothetical protein
MGYRDEKELMDYIAREQGYLNESKTGTKQPKRKLSFAERVKQSFLRVNESTSVNESAADKIVSWVSENQNATASSLVKQFGITEKAAKAIMRRKSRGLREQQWFSGVVEKALIAEEEGSETLYAFVIGDGSLYGAEPNGDGADFWIGHGGDIDDENMWGLYELKNIPLDLAEKLMKQGTNEQVFSDGYEAWEAARPYYEYTIDTVEDVDREWIEQIHNVSSMGEKKGKGDKDGMDEYAPRPSRIKNDTLYVAWSSAFDNPNNKYDKDAISQALIDAGAGRVWEEKQYGWSNQPEVILFDGISNEDATEALNSLPMFSGTASPIVRRAQFDWSLGDAHESAQIGERVLVTRGTNRGTVARVQMVNEKSIVLRAGDTKFKMKVNEGYRRISGRKINEMEGEVTQQAVSDKLAQEFGGNYINHGDVNFVEYGGTQVKFDPQFNDFEVYELTTPDSGYELGWILSEGTISFSDMVNEDMTLTSNGAEVLNFIGMKDQWNQAMESGDVNSVASIMAAMATSWGSYFSWLEDQFYWKFEDYNLPAGYDGMGDEEEDARYEEMQRDIAKQLRNWGLVDGVPEVNEKVEREIETLLQKHYEMDMRDRDDRNALVKILSEKYKLGRNQTRQVLVRSGAKLNIVEKRTSLVKRLTRMVEKQEAKRRTNEEKGVFVIGGAEGIDGLRRGLLQNGFMGSGNKFEKVAYSGDEADQAEEYVNVLAGQYTSVADVKVERVDYEGSKFGPQINVTITPKSETNEASGEWKSIGNRVEANYSINDKYGLHRSKEDGDEYTYHVVFTSDGTQAVEDTFNSEGEAMKALNRLGMGKTNEASDLTGVQLYRSYRKAVEPFGATTSDEIHGPWQAVFDDESYLRSVLGDEGFEKLLAGKIVYGGSGRDSYRMKAEKTGVANEAEDFFAVEVIDTINNQKEGGKTVQHVAATSSEKAESQYQTYLKQYGKGREDGRYVVQILKNNKVVKDSQGSGGTTRTFEAIANEPAVKKAIAALKKVKSSGIPLSDDDQKNEFIKAVQGDGVSLSKAIGLADSVMGYDLSNEEHYKTAENKLRSALSKSTGPVLGESKVIPRRVHLKRIAESRRRRRKLKEAEQETPFSLDDETLGQLLDMAAETNRDLDSTFTMGFDDITDIERDELHRLAVNFEKAAETAAQNWAKETNPEFLDGYTIGDITNDELFGYKAYMGVLGHGIGIWDGTFDHITNDAQSLSDYLDNDDEVINAMNELDRTLDDFSMRYVEEEEQGDMEEGKKCSRKSLKKRVKKIKESRKVRRFHVSEGTDAARVYTVYARTKEQGIVESIRWFTKDFGKKNAKVVEMEDETEGWSNVRVEFTDGTSTLFWISNDDIDAGSLASAVADAVEQEGWSHSEIEDFRIEESKKRKPRGFKPKRTNEATTGDGQMLPWCTVCGYQGQMTDTDDGLRCPECGATQNRIITEGKAKRLEEASLDQEKEPKSLVITRMRFDDGSDIWRAGTSISSTNAFDDKSLDNMLTRVKRNPKIGNTAFEYVRFGNPFQVDGEAKYVPIADVTAEMVKQNLGVKEAKVNEEKRLTLTDKKVIRAFTEKKPAEGKLLSTDGKKLETIGFMGSGTIAQWGGDMVAFQDVGSRLGDQIVRAVKKELPANQIGEGKVNESVSTRVTVELKGGHAIEGWIADDDIDEFGMEDAVYKMIADDGYEPSDVESYYISESKDQKSGKKQEAGKNRRPFDRASNGRPRRPAHVNEDVSTAFGSDFMEKNMDDVTLPSGWEDVSWSNDASPSWVSPDGKYKLWVEYKNKDERESPNYARFSLITMDEDGDDDPDGPSLDTESWKEMEDFINSLDVNESRINEQYVISVMDKTNDKEVSRQVTDDQTESDRMYDDAIRKYPDTNRYSVKKERSGETVESNDDDIDFSAPGPIFVSGISESLEKATRNKNYTGNVGQKLTDIIRKALRS